MLRQYLDTAEAKEYNPSLDNISFTTKDIDTAEAWVDSLLPVEVLTDSLAEALQGTAVFEDPLTFNGSTVNIPTFSNYTEDYFSFTVLKVLDTGRMYPVTNNVGGVLTIDGTVSGDHPFQIFQLGKLPRKIDIYIGKNKTFKNIPIYIKQAVSYQLEYMVRNREWLSSVQGAFTSESIGGSYSYTRADAGQDSIYNRTDRRAIDILKSEGELTQTI